MDRCNLDWPQLRQGPVMNGGHVLQILGLILLLLGGIAVALQLTGNGQPVMWLGAVGPIIMGCAILLIGRQINRER